MKIDEALQTMNLNQFEGLFQTSIKTEFQSYICGMVVLRFEDFEGTIDIGQVVTRVKKCFDTTMQPYVKKVQNDRAFTQKQVELYHNEIETTKRLISKIDALYKKVCEKENTHIVRRNFNHVLEQQFKKLRIEDKDGVIPPCSSGMFEDWYQDYRTLKMDVSAHDQLLQNHFNAQKAKIQEKIEAAKNFEKLLEDLFNFSFQDSHSFHTPKFQNHHTFYFRTDPFQDSHSFHTPKFQNHRTFYFRTDPFQSNHFNGFSPSRQRPAFDPYKVLNVDNDATPDQIKKAYHKIARECHPDKNLDDPKATQKFQRLEEAYAILKDSEKRANFDAYGVVHKHADL